MDRVRIALIGAGSMANRVHYPSLASFADVELVAICDIQPERLEATARRFSIPLTFVDYRRMLREVDADAVYVLMPPHQLFDICMDCLEAGRHLFMEKPPGVSTEQARAFAHSARSHGVIGMVGFNRRFIPLNRLCKERVGSRGGVTYAVSTFYKCYRKQPQYYRGAVDILTSDAIHAVDMLRWMAGEVSEVAAIVEQRDADYDTVFTALLKFEGGATGVLLANWTVGGRLHRFEMHGQGISAFFDPDRAATLVQDNGEPETISTQAAAGSDDFRIYYGFEAENRHFVDCLRAGTQPECSLDDAVRTMELLDRIRIAARKGWC